MNTFLSLQLIIGIVTGALLGVVGTALFARRKGQEALESPELRFTSGPPQSGVVDHFAQQVKPSSLPSGSVLADLATSVFERSDSSAKVRQQCLVGSLRGSLHSEEGSPRQDAFATFVAGDWTAFVLLDGVSSAEEAHVGSSFLAQSFERLFNNQFPNGPTSENMAWIELRTSLSQHLVAMFVSKEKQAGRQPGGDVDFLRVEALRRFGTTTEALFVRSEIGDGNQSEYVYARLAGDGSLFSISQDALSCLTSDQSLLDFPKGPVGAIPAFDGETLILTGLIEPQAALVLVTDGIGDHIDTCDLLRENLVALAQDSTVSHEAIIQFLGFNCAEAGDDRTIAMVRIR